MKESEIETFLNRAATRAVLARISENKNIKREQLLEIVRTTSKTRNEKVYLRVLLATLKKLKMIEWTLKGYGNRFERTFEVIGKDKDIEILKERE